MTTYNVKVDINAMTLDDLIALNDPEMLRDFRIMRNFIARFMAGEDGKILPDEEARKIAGAIKLGELKGLLEQITTAVSDSVNPQSGDS